MHQSLAIYLLVAALWIVTPGQDTALTIRNTLLGGRLSGWSTTVGIIAGQQAWNAASALGVAAVLSASRVLFVVLQLVGSGYLCYLGIRAVIAAAKDQHGLISASGNRSSDLGSKVALRQGTVSNLTNPKAGAFFASLIPQFSSAVPTMLMLGATFSLMTMTWLSMYVVAVHQAASVLRRPVVSRALELLTGLALIALGVHLATELAAGVHST